MKKYFFTCLFIGILQLVKAHNGTIKGQLIDAQSKLPIENTNVVLNENLMQTQTDAFGKFQFSDIEAKEFTIQTSMLGYEKQSIKIKVKDHETTNITISLKVKKVIMEDVKIVKSIKGNIDLLQKIDLQTRPIQSAQDVLKIVPGLFIAQHAGGGKAEQIFLRGFDCDHGTDIALSVDGMPVNMVSHAHGQGYADLHFVIPETIEKVKVRKGPYHSSIGDFSTAGAIQFVTKNQFDNNSIILEKGMFNYNRLALTTNLLKNKLDSNQSHLIFAGEYNYNNSYFTKASNLNRINIFTKYTSQLNANNTLTAQASYFNSMWDGSGQIPERAVLKGSINRFGSIDTTEGGNTSRANVSVSLLSALKNNAIIKNQFFVNNYKFNLYSNFTFYKNDTINGDAIQQTENRNIYGYNGSFIKNNRILNKAGTTELGLQIRYDDIKNSALTNVKQRDIVLNQLSYNDIHQANGAVYLDHQLSFSKKLQVNIGARYDVLAFSLKDKLSTNTIFTPPIIKGKLSPKLNAYYTFNKQLQLYALAGKSFHSNDARVVVAQHGQQILPTATGSELGMYIKPNKKIYINTSLWQLYSQQEFVYVGDEAVVEPGEPSKRMGVDVGVRYALHKNLVADADINYTLAKTLNVPEAENKIPLAPKFTSTGGISYDNNKQLQASIRYRHLGVRSANNANTLIAQGYTILDASVAYKIKKMSYHVYAENLLNTQWREAQFETETQLKQETTPITEMHFTSGTPLAIKLKLCYNF